MKKYPILMGFLIFLAAAIAAMAQTPSSAPAVTPPPVAVAAPALDELDRSYLQIAALSEQLAYSECQRLESVQKFNATLTDVLTRIEARHPGYTLDRAKGVLVAKGK